MKFVFALAFLVSVDAFAAQTILTNVNGRDHSVEEQLTLNADGTCTRNIRKGKSATWNRNKTQTETSGACAYMRAAKQIEQTVGTCSFKTSGDLVLSGKDQPGVMKWDEDDVINGIEIGEELSSVISSTEQNCLCGKLETSSRNFYVNPVNLLGEISGKYYKDTYKVVSITAAECSQFFPEHQRATIVEIYKANGLK